MVKNLSDWYVIAKKLEDMTGLGLRGGHYDVSDDRVISAFRSKKVALSFMDTDNKDTLFDLLETAFGKVAATGAHAVGFGGSGAVSVHSASPSDADVLSSEEGSTSASRHRHRQSISTQMLTHFQQVCCCFCCFWCCCCFGCCQFVLIVNAVKQKI